jgi:alkylation response protein AidB-like acyl-CoA dehydrogenase
LSIILDRPSATDADRELRAELVGRAAKLVPMLAANSPRCEQDRRIVEENITAIQQAELLSTMRPQRYGGLQTDIRTKMEVTRELARGCGATSWTVSLLNVCAWFTGLWPRQAQDDVWGDNPDSLVSGSLTPAGTATPVEGGYQVSGKWAFCSASSHTQWALLGTQTAAAPGRPAETGLVLIPKSEVSIEDTWFVVGMSGTGSNTIVSEDVFVPAHRYISMDEAMQGRYATPFTDEALYRSAFLPVGALILAGPHLGLASAAMDLVVEKAPRRVATMTVHAKQSEVPGVQLDLGKAAALIDSAHLHAYRAAAEIDENAHNGVYPDYEGRARARMDTGMAVQYAREAIRMLVSVHGAASFATANSLQRIWRDSEVASSHTILRQEINSQLYGQALLGIEDSVTPIF